MEGKIFVRLDQVKNSQIWQLTVGCNLPGKWILHWGVSYVGDVGRYACFWIIRLCNYVPYEDAYIEFKYKL